MTLNISLSPFLLISFFTFSALSPLHVSLSVSPLCCQLCSVVIDSWPSLIPQDPNTGSVTELQNQSFPQRGPSKRAKERERIRERECKRDKGFIIWKRERGKQPTVKVEWERSERAAMMEKVEREHQVFLSVCLFRAHSCCWVASLQPSFISNLWVLGSRSLNKTFQGLGLHMGYMCISVIANQDWGYMCTSVISKYCLGLREASLTCPSSPLALLITPSPTQCLQDPALFIAL